MMTATMDPHATPHHAPPVNERGRVHDPDATDDERTLSLVGHLSALGHLAFPGLAILAPILIWANKKDTSPFVADHMKEAMNFQITLILYTAVLVAATVVTFGFGVLLTGPLGLAVHVLAVVGMILGAVAANRGEYFRYPMTLRFIK